MSVRANSVASVKVNELQVIDPHCIQITPVDRIAQIDLLPGRCVLLTLAKTQVALDGGRVSVVQARMEWPLDLFMEARDAVRRLLDPVVQGDGNDRLRALPIANALPA